MLRYLFLRFILPLIAFLIVRAVLKSLWGARGASAVANHNDTATPAGGELKQDPVCGTYVAVNASVTRKVGGETLHFCSAACRDKYRVA